MICIDFGSTAKMGPPQPTFLDIIYIYVFILLAYANIYIYRHSIPIICCKVYTIIYWYINIYIYICMYVYIVGVCIYVYVCIYKYRHSIPIMWCKVYTIYIYIFQNLLTRFTKPCLYHFIPIWSHSSPQLPPKSSMSQQWSTMRF